MQILTTKLDKLLAEHPVENPDKFKADVLSLIDTYSNYLARQQVESKDVAIVSIKDLEDIVLALRDLKAKYETSASSTVSDVIKLDELKQLEYKLTERILNAR